MTHKISKLDVARALCFGAFTILCIYLFFLESTNVLVSDFPAHIERALDPSLNGYTALSGPIWLAYQIGGELGVSVLIGLFELATLIVTERLMRNLAPNANAAIIMICALCCNVAIALYAPFVHPYLTRGLSSGNAWHNSTYIVMRLMGICAIWSYLRFVGRFESKNHLLDLALFALFSMLATATKPNFILSFGPAIAILCFYDLKKQGKCTLKRSFALAAALMLSVAVIAMQSTLLYAESETTGIALGFASLWRRFHNCVPIGMLQSYAFPLIVLCFCVRMRYKDRNYQLAWAIFLVSLLIYLFLKETGTRKLHGNFGWGLKFGIYYLMIVSVCAFLQTRQAQLHELFGLPIAPSEQLEIHASNVAGDSEAEKPIGPAILDSKAFDIVAIALFTWHTISGIISLCSIFAGNGYA